MIVASLSSDQNSFFRNLDKECVDLDTFQKAWKRTLKLKGKQEPLHPSDLSFILDKSVTWVLSAGGNQNLKEACLDYIKSNINLWHKHGSLMSKNAKANHVSIPLWAMGKIAVLPNEKVLQHVESNFFAKNPNTQAIANVMTAFKDMGHKPSAKFLQHVESDFFAKNPNTQAIANVMTAFKDMGHKPSAKFLRHVESDFFAKNPDAQNIANVMTAFKDMGHKPSAKFLRHVESDFFAKNPNAQDIANVLFAMADLGYMPSGNFLDQAKEILQKNPDHQNIANTLWACAVFASLDKAADSQFDFKDFAQELLQHAENENITFSVEGQRQVFDACYLFDLQSPVECPKSYEKSGSHEQDLTQIFNDAFAAKGLRLVAKCDEGKDIDVLNRSVDIRIHDQDTDKIITYLELDGTDHMVEELKNGKFDLVGYNGRTGLQTLLIHKAVPDTPLLRMPYFVKNLLKQEDKAARNEMIANYFSALANGEFDTKPKMLTFGKESSTADYPLNPEYLELAP